MAYVGLLKRYTAEFLCEFFSCGALHPADLVRISLASKRESALSLNVSI